MTPKAKLKLICGAIEDKQGQDVRILDISKVSSFTDYFVLCTANNPRQSQSIADEIEARLKKESVRPSHIEGRRSNDWVLLDYGDIVVHIFSPAYRSFYALERLWSDGKTIDPGILQSRKSRG
ncbi:MAG: ribosome silencing factor [Acidobacteriota bacterium]